MAGQPYQFQVKINSRDTPQGLLIQPEVVPSQHSAPLPAGKACTAKASNSSNPGALAHCPDSFLLLPEAIGEHNYWNELPLEATAAGTLDTFLCQRLGEETSAAFFSFYADLPTPISPLPTPTHGDKIINLMIKITNWAIQAGMLTPFTFARHRLSPLAAFTSGAYFLHNGRQ